jgi:hypothetical protein
MVSFKHILLVSVVLASAYSKIALRDGLPDFQLLRDDVADFNLKSIFDFSSAKGKVTFETNVGKTFVHGTPFAMKNYDVLGVKEPNFIRAHDNWVIAVYDNTRVIFQALDSDGKRILHFQSVDLKKFGANLVCTGSAWNHKRGYMYIGCFDKTSTEAKQGAMYIFTWDFHSQSIINEVSVKQDDGFRIINRLNIFIESFPQEGQDDDQLYLVAYDQGHTLQKETRFSNHARIFFNVETGKLEFDTLVQVNMPDHNYDAIYDMYPYQNTLIISGRLKGVSSILTLAQCKLDLTDNLINCNPNYKGTLIESGMVQVDQENMRYHELDLKTKEIRYYELHGKFTDKNWNTKLLNKMEDVSMPKLDEEHYWIRGIHPSQWGGVIYFGSYTHQDPGVTFLNWEGKESFYDANQVATVYDRDYVLLGVHEQSHALMLVRDEPLFLIEGGFYSGNNQIALTAMDDDGQVTASGNMIVLDGIFDKVNIRNNIGTIELLANEAQLFSFKEDDIIDGNGLSVEVKSADPSLVTALGYTQAPVRVTWEGKGDLAGDYAFSHDKVFLVDKSNTLKFGICHDVSPNPITVSCSEEGTHHIGSGYKLNPKVYTQGTLAMGYSTNLDKQKSVVYLFDEEGEFEKHTFNGIIHDAGFLKGKTFYYVFVVFDQDRVEIWSVNPNDFKEFEKFFVLNSENINFDHFCPTAVSIPPHSTDEYDVLSDCGLVGKAVLRMGISYNTSFFSVPLSMRHTTKGFCSFKDEFVINTFKEVFSVAGNDTFNYWTVPMEELDGAFNYEMHCIPTLHKVAYVAHGSKGLSNTLVTQNAVEGAINQGRRFPSFVEGVEAESIRVYELLDRIIYVIENMEQTTFLTTFDTPRIKFKAGQVNDEEDVLLTITVKNKSSKQTFLQMATVYPIE